MSKDPAFLMYSQDFIVGIQTMNFEDRGKYITILLQMHQQGRMDEETIRFLVGNVSDKLKNKFSIDKNGLWYNKRLEFETEKRNNFVQSRRINGSQGGRPVIKLEPLGKPTRKYKDKHKDSLMGNEDENENVIVIKDEKGKLIYPFTSEGFFKKWDLWKQYRKELKKSYKGIIAEQSALKHLSELSDYDEITALEIIDYSMGQGYHGLFKSNKNINGKQAGESANEKYMGGVREEAIK